MTKKQKSLGNKSVREVQKNKKFTLSEMQAALSEEAKNQMQNDKKRIENAESQISQPNRYFDGMNLYQVIQACKDGRATFLGPKPKNKGDVRVKTGVTEGKIDAVVNVAFNQSIEAEVHAFNEFDIEDVKLGEAMTKVNFRTNQWEEDEDFWYDFLYELTSMPAVFVQEGAHYNTSQDVTYSKKIDREEVHATWYDMFLNEKDKSTNVTFDTEEYTRITPRKYMWTADQVLLADITIPARRFHEQPYIITHRQIPFSMAKGIYKNAPRWKYVQAGRTTQFEDSTKTEQSSINSNICVNKDIDDGYVEEIVITSLQNREMQIYLAGVPMLPPGTPMRTNGSRYPLEMYIPKPINENFAYGRSIVMQTRVLSALRDESFRFTILKNKQDIWKPIVTRAKQVLDKEMWLPGMVTYGIDKADISELSTSAISGTDFGMLDMIESEIEKIVNINPLLQGQSAGSRTTAEEVSQRMKQAMVMIGSILVMYMRAKRNGTYARITNLFENFLEPIDQRANSFMLDEKGQAQMDNTYRAFSISNEDMFGSGIGREIIQFMDRDLVQDEVNLVNKIQIDAKQKNKPIKFTFINFKKISKLRQYFYVTVIPKEKRSSALEREMLKKDIMDNITIGEMLGKKPNADYVTSELARRTMLDPNKLWQPNPQQPPNPADAAQQAGRMGRDGAPVRPKTIQPSIPNMANFDASNPQI